MTKPFYSRRQVCRLCDSAQVECVFQLEPSALAEWYLPPERAHEADQRFPLDLFLCRSCGHVQLFDLIDPERLFTNYVYTSASSPGLEQHFSRYAENVVGKLNLAPESLAVDVGSNDGTLLRQFAKRGMRVVGIDPATAIAKAATAAGIPTYNAFMEQETARKLVQDYGLAKLCTANNVFAHNDHLGDMAEAIASLLDQDGVFVFEVSYLLDTVEGLVFDFIYHEHLCYHSVKPLDIFLRRHGLHLFDVERSPSKGGSLRAFAQKLGGHRPVASRVGEFIALEEAARLRDPSMYRSYIQRVNSLRDQTVEYLQGERARGATIAGYGASATVTTLLHHFKIGQLFDFLVDDNPIRHGTLSPGYRIPVKHPQALYQDKPDIVVVLAWRFAQSILNQHPAYLRQGGKFVVPVPTFREHHYKVAAA